MTRPTPVRQFSEIRMQRSELSHRFGRFRKGLQQSVSRLTPAPCVNARGSQRSAIEGKHDARVSQQSTTCSKNDKNEKIPFWGEKLDFLCYGRPYALMFGSGCSMFSSTTPLRGPLNFLEAWPQPFEL